MACRIERTSQDVFFGNDVSMWRIERDEVAFQSMEADQMPGLNNLTAAAIFAIAPGTTAAIGGFDFHAATT